MKRYLLFVYRRFYPCGGWNDFADSFDSVPAALGHLATIPDRDPDPFYALHHVVDSETWTIVDGDDEGAQP
jgi:hypothetical protein